MSSSSDEDQSSVARHRSLKPSETQPSGRSLTKTNLNMIQTTFITGKWLSLTFPPNTLKRWPDPRESTPRSSSSVIGLDDEKGHQELRPRGPSSMLPLSSVIKDAFDKFERDIQAANLPEGKYLPLQSGTSWDSPVTRRKYRS